MINVCYNCSNEFNINLICSFCNCVGGQIYCSNNFGDFKLCYFVNIVCWSVDYCFEWC